MQSFVVISKRKNQATSAKTTQVATGEQLNNGLAGFAAIDSKPDISSLNSNIVKKIPVLKITINKKYNKRVSNVDTNKQSLNIVNNVNEPCKIEQNHVDEEETTPVVNNCTTDNISVNCTNTTTVSPQPMVFDVLPMVLQTVPKIEDAMTELESICTPKSAYTRKGDLSRHYSRCQTSIERLQYLYTKARRECDVLAIRLKALKERHKQEMEEVRMLQLHLDDSSNETLEEYHNEMTKRTKRQRSEEEEEYEKLLRKARKMREDLLYPKYSESGIEEI